MRNQKCTKRNRNTTSEMISIPCVIIKIPKLNSCIKFKVLHYIKSTIFQFWIAIIFTKFKVLCFCFHWIFHYFINHVSLHPTSLKVNFRSLQRHYFLTICLFVVLLCIGLKKVCRTILVSIDMHFSEKILTASVSSRGP